RKLGKYPEISLPKKIEIDDSMIINPPEDPSSIEIIRGPNIVPLPKFEPLPEDIKIKILIKVEDNITTDHILPAGAKVLPYRSNLPEISNFVFGQRDETFSRRALEVKEKGGGTIIGGENYGQGSSREHAALAPRYLGIKAVIAKSFARIHRDNLVNFGIVPFVFVNENDYEKVYENDILEIKAIKTALNNNSKKLKVRNLTQNSDFEVNHDLSEREISIIIAGGKLNYTKELIKK
ncbi:MAG: aconitate hydratase, partial [Candidatus Hermodarchaeota archaeon]